jgi:branched-chain amino acid aminotransferase
METALLNYFVLDTQLRSACDLNPNILEEGVGIYEVLRVEQGIPVFLQEHIDRFFSSASLENIPLDISRKFIRQSVKLLIEQNRMQQGNIKFIYHWNSANDHRFMAWVMPFFYPAATHYNVGVVVGSMQAERQNPNAKKVLYSLRKQADALIKKEGFWEVVYVNSQGYLTEGSRSNIFFVRDNYMLTPELSLVLPGITRAKVLQLAVEKGIPLEETRIKLSEPEKYDACFLTGTSPKILPVSRLDNKPFDVQNKLMRALMEDYGEMMAEDILRFSW